MDKVVWPWMSDLQDDLRFILDRPDLKVSAITDNQGASYFMRVDGTKNGGFCFCRLCGSNRYKIESEFPVSQEEAFNKVLARIEAWINQNI